MIEDGYQLTLRERDETNQNYYIYGEEKRVMKPQTRFPKLLLFLIILTCALCANAMGDNGAIPLDISDDGTYILVTGSNYNGLALVNTQNDESVLITNSLNAGYYASISPDNRYVCYKLIQPTKKGALLQAPMLYDIEEQWNIPLSRETKLAGTPDISESGNIAYTVGNELFILDSELEIVSMFDLEHHVNLVALSPDGERVAFNNEKEQIVILNLSDGTMEPATDVSGSFWGPEFSPDGEKILVRSAAGGVFCKDLLIEKLSFLGKGESAAWQGNNQIAFIEKVVKKRKVLRTNLVTKSLDGISGNVSMLKKGDAKAALANGKVASLSKGNIKCGDMRSGSAVWNKQIAVPDGLRFRPHDQGGSPGRKRNENHQRSLPSPGLRRSRLVERAFILRRVICAYGDPVL